MRSGTTPSGHSPGKFWAAASLALTLLQLALVGVLLVHGYQLRQLRADLEQLRELNEVLKPHR